MATHLRENSIQYSPQTIRENTKVEFLWQGNAISCMKSFGVLRCQLCMAEKLAIRRASWQQPALLLNRASELDEGCKHAELVGSMIVSVEVQIALMIPADG